jgi:hypothetical protein
MPDENRTRHLGPNFPFIEELAHERRVLAPYLPGTGPGPYATRRLDGLE